MNEERNRAARICKACDEAGISAMAGKLISTGITVEQAEQLAPALAEPAIDYESNRELYETELGLSKNAYIESRQSEADQPWPLGMAV